MTLKRNNRGMTAVEALISLSVASAVGVALAAILSLSMSGFGSGTSKEASVNSATIALQKLANEIRDAKSATVSGGVLTVTFPLKVQDPTTGEYVYDLSANDPVARSYYVNNGNLVRNVAGRISIVARGIVSVTFATSGRDVQITLRSEEQVGRQSASEEVAGRVALRNVKN